MHMRLQAVVLIRGCECLYRSALSPERLRGTFEPPYDQIRTLHDNWEASVKEHAQVRLRSNHRRTGIPPCAVSSPLSP